MTSKLDKLFGSKTRTLLLSKLMMDSDRRFYIRELSKSLNIPYGMLYREVKNLITLGILVEEKKGKITLLSVNKKLPYFYELKSLMMKTTGLSDIIRGVLAGLKGIRYALIYGSFARGEDTESSDIDLLIIGEVGEESLITSLSRVEKDLGREINYILWNERDFIKRLKEKHHLLSDIIRKPFIMLIGDEDEFRRVVKR